jgi:multimeric flavodoxin WrbA
MKVTIIHGQMHKGSTYHVAHMLIEKLKSISGNLTVNEFFLPKDGPDFCMGCYQCYEKGEENCPHNNKMLPIVNAIVQADIVIMESPTYVYDVTGQMKAFLDHLGYMWLSHRPNESMFRKQGVVISTAAFNGTKLVTNNLKRQLFWLGLSRIYTMRFNTRAGNWEQVNSKLIDKMEKKAQNIALSLTGNAGKIKPTLTEKIFFNIMRYMQKSKIWITLDNEHWNSRGWLGAKRPWKTDSKLRTAY